MKLLHKALLVRNAANRLLKVLTVAFFPGTPQVVRRLRQEPGRVLILRTGNLGDTACALPAFAALRNNFPRAHLCLLTSSGRPGLPQAGELLEGLGLVDEILTYYPEDFKNRTWLRNLLISLRGRRFDLFILLPQGRVTFRRVLRDVGFACSVGAKGALGFTLTHHFPFFDPRRLKDYVPPENEAQRLLGLLRAVGINSGCSFQVSLPKSCQGKANDFLRPYLYPNHHPVIGFQVKSKAGSKQWPLANFSELGRRLEEAFHPVFVLFGGPGEAEDLHRFASTFPGDKLVAAGKTSVQESLALLARCRAFVTLDTGPMHLAALVNTPTVALFSARQFRKMWEPNSENALVLRKTVPCELCFQNDCHHLTCMRAISPDEVFCEMTKILSKNTSLPELGVQG